MALFLEESLYRGLQWAVFEPNDEPLWSAIRLNVGSFMQALFQKQAFQGQTPDEAYLVKCDSETTTQTGDPSTSRKSPGRTEYDAITLERGVTYDPAFEAWAASVWAVGAGLGAEVSLASFRKDILLTSSTRQARRSSATRFSAAGSRNIRRCPIWTPTPTRWRFSTSSWRTRAGSVTPR